MGASAGRDRTGRTRRAGRCRASAEGVTLRLTNRQDVRGTTWLRGTMDVLVDGIVVGHVRLPRLDIAPHRSDDVVVPLPAVVRHAVADDPGAEVTAVVRFTCRADQPWRRPATSWPGTRSSCDRPAPAASGARWRGRARRRQITAAVDPEGGRLVQLHADGVPLLVDPVELSLWRAAIDNDGLKLLGVRSPAWMAGGCPGGWRSDSTGSRSAGPASSVRDGVTGSSSGS